MPGIMLDDTDISVISEYLQWQFVQPEVVCLRACQVKTAIHFGLDPAAGSLAMQMVMDTIAHAEHVIFPVHCDEPLHWTAMHLKVEKGSSKILQVLYYDWCFGIVENAALAQKILGVITLRKECADAPLKLPKPRNAYRQLAGSNDCGFAVWQALENAHKSVRLEGPCGILPSPQSWRKLLKSSLQTATQAPRC